ncbi:organic hydroperoxide resistance protein [Saccharothrix algeriensis]|uniref:Ohr subfamily peroxiredoxin n=1 Tax=Saccharothrix algeriensis TaxID=173560 RepID=A0A8T8I4A4_9PSEU|nr:organic hydroperoxide resistance protein [Saccharothrix algeriensis]MBM7811939.1 Ohr subfamily peroxiredoxin [Saccharothrix algeriensis]QTR05642.1 organic hydroperoxide resistance protein [Saccharothrix algeriensis]
MQVLYTAEATATGDGRNGEVRSSDGVLDEQLTTPQELGGAGGPRTNPEQLFAAGYAACFHSALRVAGRQSKVPLGETTVAARVGIGPDGAGGYQLTVDLRAHLPGVEQSAAEELVALADRICPYSNAMRGNVEVALTATV